jgi:LPXTG-motif cell wall-anchored protein
LKAQVTASAGSKIVNIANGGVGNQNVSSNPVPVSSPALASTGAQVAQGLTIAVALVVLGGVALALGRRRKGSS